MLTEEKGIQTFVGHELINQHLFLSLKAASKESDKIHVLEFSYKNKLIFELH